MKDICHIGQHKFCNGMLEVLIEVETEAYSIMCDVCMVEWDNPVDALNDENGYRKSYDKKVSRSVTEAEVISAGWEKYLYEYKKSEFDIKKLELTEDVVSHIIGSVVDFSYKNGINGGHNYNKLLEYFDNSVMPFKIIDTIPHEVVKGIFDVIYKRGAQNYKGQFEIDKWTVDTYIKTVYDPNIILDSEIINIAKNALKGSKIYITEGNQFLVKGSATNGLKFEGWIDSETKKLKSYYPIMKKD